MNVKFDAAHKDLMISIGYWTSSISEWQADNVASTMARLLRSVAEDGDKPVLAIQPFSDRDKRQVLEWNQAPPQTIAACVHDIIAKQVFAQPNAQAICAWDADFTYAELDEASTRLAHRLVQLGVGPEVMVPLCFEKSAWTVIAMLAVLKAGGVFVPLDPSHPVNRLADIIQDLDAKLLLSSVQYSNLCTAIVESVFVVGPLMSELTNHPEAGLPCTTVSSKNAAYVIFTSGTTGKPKGTVVEHGTYCTASAAHGKTMLMGPSSRVLQFASYVYDASLVEILTALMHGACICVPDEETRLNDAVAFINSTRANWALLTPSFMTTIEPESIPGLEILLLGGEAMSQRHVLAWADRLQLFNAYGPSECAVIATMKHVTSIDMTTQAGNIGTGVGGVCWIVDSADHNKLAPIGCVGELLMEGPLLARGYLKNPEKTAAVFVDNPVWARGGEYGRNRRMYRTGDLVRYNPDGTIEYLGRKDTQVKLHGQRLELGEIEHHLLSDNNVTNAMVTMAMKGQSKDKLVAIMALREFTSISEPQSSEHREIQLLDKARMGVASVQLSHLQEQLSSQLPLYMVPTVYVIVEELPLNTSGKLDRSQISRWLEEMDEETYSQILDAEKEQALGPITVMDRKLQEIVGRVLNLSVDCVMLHRSFLSLGGDSITAMQLVSRGRAEGIAVRVQDILQSENISQLALVARVTHGASMSYEEEVDTEFDLSPIQRMYFVMSGQRVNQFNQSFYIRFRHPVGAGDVARAIQAVVRQHSMLRSRFKQTESGQWCQFITTDVNKSHRFTLHEVKALDEVTSVMTASQASLDVEKGSLFTADMFQMESGEQLMFLLAHHLVVDLVSWRVILQDFEEVLNSGTLSAKKPFPFQAWLKLQAEHMQQHPSPKKLLPFDVVPADYAYWGMMDRSNTYGDAKVNTFTIDAATTSTFFEGCQEALGTKPAEVFLATLLLSFCQTFTNRTAPTVFSEGHGREPWNEEVDLSGTVGWFTTMSPLYVAVDKGADLLDVVRRVKDTGRKLPSNGRPYFASRFLNSEGASAFADHAPMELLFNYIGRYQQLEREDGLLAQETLPVGTTVSDVGLDVQRLALFEISIAVVRGITEFTIVSNRLMEHQDEIENWILAWKLSLQEAVERLPKLNNERTLSDFPLLSITEAGLDKLKNERLQEINVESFEEIEDVYPCSPMQQGMLLSQSVTPGAYEVAFLFETIAMASSPIDVERLLSAWQQVVDRHAALRTVFTDSVSEDGIFDQIVLKRLLTRTVLKQCTGSDTDALVLLNEQRHMDYADCRPLHRLTLCQTTSGRVFCKLEISHAIMDAASFAALLVDFNLAYEGKLSRGSGPLYSDYMRYLQERPLDIAMNFWKEHLDGVEPCHFPLLNTDRSDSKQLKYLAVDADMPPNALHAFCERNGVTVATVVQAVWGLVLRSYTGSDHVCFGYLSSGRDIPVEGIEGAVGPFINMLVSRVDAVPTSSVSQLVRDIQEGYLAGLEHQYCSLAQIQHSLNLSGRPLFNSLMSVQRVPSISREKPTISFDVLGGNDPTEVSAICETPQIKQY